MDVSEIVDRDSFEAWLEALPEYGRREVAVTLATRAALRVFPLWLVLLHGVGKGEPTVLPLGRALMVSAVAGGRSTPEIKDAARPARDFARAAEFERSAKDPSGNAEVAAYAAARSAASAASVEAVDTVFSRQIVARAVRAMDFSADAADLVAAYSDAWVVLRSDIEAWLRGDGILERPLWALGTEPERLQQAWTKGRAWMEAAPGHAFWIRWYEAVLAGRPLTGDWDSHWQLMHDIALIDPDDWGEGKELDALRVAGIIDLITQKHALQQEVARAKRALENETFNAMTLGRHRDNLPDDMPTSQIVEYRARLQELETALDEVDAALEPPIPDVEVLEEATGRLWAVWEKIKKYPVALAFVTLIGAAATGAAGQAGVRGMDWFFDQGMPQLIRGSKDIAPKPSAAPKPQKGWEKPSVDL